MSRDDWAVVLDRWPTIRKLKWGPPVHSFPCASRRGGEGKVAGTICATNGLGAYLYWREMRRKYSPDSFNGYLQMTIRNNHFQRLRWIRSGITERQRFDSMEGCWSTNSRFRGFNTTQYAFAQRIGVSQSYLSAMERGEKEICAEILLKISKEFGRSLDWLLTG